MKLNRNAPTTLFIAVFADMIFPDGWGTSRRRAGLQIVIFGLVQRDPVTALVRDQASGLCLLCIMLTIA